MSNTNLALWNHVRKPNPKHLKKVKQRGGFTSIDAQGQLMEATKIFGPIGSTWGLEDLKWGIIHGPKLVTVEDESGVDKQEWVQHHPLQITLDAKFYYPDVEIDGIKVPGGSFEISTDIEWAARGECRKKARTDLLTKALSQIGFAADVFLNKWDGDRYKGDDAAGDTWPVSEERKAQAMELIHQLPEKSQKKALDTLDAAGWNEDAVLDAEGQIKAFLRKKGGANAPATQPA